MKIDQETRERLYRALGGAIAIEKALHRKQLKAIKVPA